MEFKQVATKYAIAAVKRADSFVGLLNTKANRLLLAVFEAELASPAAISATVETINQFGPVVESDAMHALFAGLMISFAVAVPLLYGMVTGELKGADFALKKILEHLERKQE
ncbi:MAG: hypothetical protein ACP5IK_00355 [Candidatus Micrarchaeia archaeon]|jgi:hypothetical protein